MAVPTQSPAVVSRGTDAGVETVVSTTGAAGRDVTAGLALLTHGIALGTFLDEVNTSTEVFV